MKNTPMKFTFLVAIFAAVLGLSSVSFAQVSTPESLIKKVYKVNAIDWKNNSSSIINAKSRKTVEAYFDKTLSDLIWKDIKARGEEVGALDFDPFYNAQDASITNLVVGKAKISGNEATVVVTFLNFKAKNKLTYKLSKSDAGWRISDILYPEGITLLKLFQDTYPK